MATEDDALRAIAAEPDNVDFRRRFDDWLVENDALAKAEFVRAEYSWQGATLPGESKCTEGVVRVLARSLDPVWVARIARPPVGVCSGILAMARVGAECGPVRTFAELHHNHDESDDDDWVPVRIYPPTLTAMLLNGNGFVPCIRVRFTVSQADVTWTVTQFCCRLVDEESDTAEGPESIRWRENPLFGGVSGLWVIAYCIDDEEQEAAVCLEGEDDASGRVFLLPLDDTDVPDSIPANGLVFVADSLPRWLSRLRVEV